MTRIFCGVVGFVLLVASAAVADQGAGTAAAIGSYLTTSPTNEIIAVWPVGGSRITFFGVEKGKPIGHIDPKFQVVVVMFSLSGRFICVGGYTPSYHVAVYDMERGLRKVIDTIGGTGDYPTCQVEGGVRKLDASVLGTRVGNTVVIQRQQTYGGPCPTPAFIDTTTQYWDAALKHPKIYKQYLSTQASC